MTDFRPLQPRSASVLVVEDNPEALVLIDAELETINAVVVSVTTLAEAMDILAVGESSIDLVILDLYLPDWNGRSLDLVKVSTMLPVVIYSSAVSVDDLPPDVPFVPKGSAFGLLASTVETMLARRKRSPFGGEVAAPVDSLALAQDLVQTLPSWTGLETWAVARVVGDDVTILACHDEIFGLTPGAIIDWSTSFVSKLGVADRAFSWSNGSTELGIRSALSIPLSTASDGFFGSLIGMSPNVATVDTRTVERGVRAIALALSTAIGLEVQQTRLQRQFEITRLASRADALTGLGNRRAWNSALATEQARCHRFGHQAVVVIADLDGLKLVNDSLGHAAGDALIERAAAVLAELLRGSDQAFRIGGDEFALLLPETDGSDQGLVLSRVRAAFESAEIPLSAGAASYPDEHTLEAAAEMADQEMYRAKLASRAVAARASRSVRT